MAPVTRSQTRRSQELARQLDEQNKIQVFTHLRNLTAMRNCCLPHRLEKAVAYFTYFAENIDLLRSVIPVTIGDTFWTTVDRKIGQLCDEAKAPDFVSKINQCNLTKDYTDRLGMIGPPLQKVIQDTILNRN